MKDVINSSNKMRDEWTNLIRVENGDKAFRMVEDGRDWYQHWPEGTYLIEGQMNRQGAPHWYVKISEKYAEKLMGMEIDEAVEAMRRRTVG